MILITSATGTVGKQIVHQLKAKGVSLTAASRNPDQAREALGVPTVELRWDKPESLAKAFTGVSTLFLGTPPGVEEEKAWGLAAVEAAKAAGVKKIVKLSAIGVEAMPESAHRQIELAIEGGGFQWVFLRPNFFMQNLDETMAEGIRSLGVISVPTGEGRTSFIDARDIAAVAVEALTRDDLNGKGLTLTGSEALTYSDLAAKFTQALGKPVWHDDISAANFTAFLVKVGVPPSYAAFLTLLYDQVVRNGHAAGITTDVKAVTGKDPIQFSSYLQDYLAAFKA